MKVITGRELYEFFNESIGFRGAVLYTELPLLYQRAWEGLADYSHSKIVAFQNMEKSNAKKESSGG